MADCIGLKRGAWPPIEVTSKVPAAGPGNHEQPGTELALAAKAPEAPHDLLPCVLQDVLELLVFLQLRWEQDPDEAPKAWIEVQDDP